MPWHELAMLCCCVAVLRISASLRPLRMNRSQNFSAGQNAKLTKCSNCFAIPSAPTTGHPIRVREHLRQPPVHCIFRPIFLEYQQQNDNGRRTGS
uniref:Secreted protein n=1 Tax=Globodera rostochiensis TaxID=31243 RepID=A0A914HT73_GLORO